MLLKVWFGTIPNQTRVSLVVFQHVDLDPSARLFVIFGHKQCFPSDDTSTTILLPVNKLVDSFTSLKKYFYDNKHTLLYFFLKCASV